MSKYGASLYNFLFNSVNSVIVIINGIVMVPMYFHYFPVSVYGAWLASGNIMAMIGLLSSGFSSVITQKMAIALSQNDINEYRSLVGANIIAAAVISLAIFSIALIVSKFVPDIVNVDLSYSKDITHAFIISAFASSISIYASLFGALPQVWQKTKVVGLINTSVNIFAIISLVSFLLCGMGIISIALSYAIRSVLNLFIQGQWIMREWKKRADGSVIFSFQKVGTLLKDCVYPLLSNIANVFMGQSTSLIIAAFLNPTLAAIYDLTGKVATVLTGFINMINGSFFALFSLTISKCNVRETENVINKVSCFLSCLIVGVLIFITCFSKPFVNLWVGLDKYGGDWLLLAIVVSSVLAQYKSFFNNLLFSAGLINKSAVLDILSLLAYLLCLMVTLKHFEQYAIPLSMGLTNLCFLWLYVNMFKKNANIDMKKTISYIIRSITYPCVIIIAYLALNISVTNYMGQFVFLFLAILYYIGYIIINKESRQIALASINKLYTRNERTSR